MTRALALPEVKTALASQGMEVAPSSPEDMAALKRDLPPLLDRVRANLDAEGGE